jgi:hypothetical protein
MLSDKAAQAEAANSFQKGDAKKQKLQIPFRLTLNETKTEKRKRKSWFDCRWRD